MNKQTPKLLYLKFVVRIKLTKFYTNNYVITYSYFFHVYIYIKKARTEFYRSSLLLSTHYGIIYH
nr:MAG TPA: hypothetical protein [Caudoviricetes sp.]